MRLLDAQALSACGIGPEDGLLVGLSGGADSVALLHALRLCRADGLTGALHAAHLVHGMRGESAERDAAFCEALCKDWDIPLTVGRVDAPAYAKSAGMTLEQAGRELRYAFLREQAASCGARLVAVAHHADDQAETVLMHLMRGSGRAGLCGMRARAGDIVRPLLDVRRATIEAYMAENGLAYCTDETNALPDAARNRVRHELLPLMESFNPRVVEAIGRMAGHMTADEAYFERLAAEAAAKAQTGGGYAADVLAALPEPVRVRALKRLLRDALGGDYREADVRRLTALLPAHSGSAIELRGGKSAWLENGALLIGALTGLRQFETPFIAWGETLLPMGRVLSSHQERFELPENGNTACVDADRLPEGAVLRTRRDGDRFHPLGAPGSRLLSDYLTDKKCPRRLRDMPLMCDGGEVLWVTGFTVSERLRVKEETRAIMRIRYEEDGKNGTDAG